MLKKNSLVKKIDTFEVIGWVCLSLVFILFVFFLTRIYPNYIDSDMSTDLVLAHEMNNSGEWSLCKNWIYTTELRVINNQLIFAILLKLFHSWKVVRIVSSGILLVILVASYIYLLDSIVEKTIVPFASIVLLIPFSNTYYDYVLSGLYYVPHIAISFLVLGITIRIYNEENIKLRNIRMVVLFIIAFLSGLGGFRQIMILSIPLAISALIMCVSYRERDNKGFLFSASEVFFASIVGCITNKLILSRNYSFADLGNINWCELSSERLFSLISGWLNTLGYFAGNSIFSKSTFYNFISFFIVLVSIYATYKLCGSKKENKAIIFCCFFILSAIIVMTGFYFTTDMTYYDRYLLPISVFVFPIITYYTYNTWKETDNNKIKIGIVILILFVFLSSLLRYNDFSKSYKGNDNREVIAKWLVENEYYTGFSIFWNANVLTELSDGKIEMYITEGYDNGRDAEYIDDLLFWGQKKSHFSDIPDGKIFFYVMEREFEHNSFYNYFKECEPSFSYGTDRVYCFESYDDIPDELFKMRIKEGKNHFEVNDALFNSNTMYNGEPFVSNGDDGATLFGPYIRLYPGKYDITVNYEITEDDSGEYNGFVDVVGDTIDFGEYQVPIDIKSNSTTIENIQLLSAVENVEIRLWTNQKGVKVKSVDIEYARE